MAIREPKDSRCQPWRCKSERLDGNPANEQWLLLEPWITPSLFRATNNDGIVDEYTFCKYQDRGVASAALKNHWETFIVENDIKWLSGE
jgi:aryl-phospho-beta-D-glucosidase BglC (GH1 family)